MFTIWKREMRNYFFTPIGYVFVGVFLLLSGILFFIYNIYTGSVDMESMFGNMKYIFILITPILTMRLISEERRTKVDQLLLTSSCPVRSIVLGKYFAACTVLLIALSGTGTFVGIIEAYSNAFLPSILCGYIGTWLLGCCYIAIGLMMSALTEKQVSAAALTYGANLLMQMVETYSAQIALPGRAAREILSSVNLYRHYMKFVAGILSFSDVIYLLTFCAFAVFLTIQWVERKRWC